MSVQTGALSFAVRAGLPTPLCLIIRQGVENIKKGKKKAQESPAAARVLLEMPLHPPDRRERGTGQHYFLCLRALAAFFFNPLFPSLSPPPSAPTGEQLRLALAL